MSDDFYNLSWYDAKTTLHSLLSSKQWKIWQLRELAKNGRLINNTSNITFSITGDRIYLSQPYWLVERLTMAIKGSGIIALLFTFHGDRHPNIVTINGTGYNIGTSGPQIVWFDEVDDVRVVFQGITALVNVEAVDKVSYEKEREYYKKQLVDIGMKREEWLIERKRRVDAVLSADDSALLVSNFNRKSKFFTSRGIHSSSNPLQMYRKHLEAKFASPETYGIHPFATSLNHSLSFYIRERGRPKWNRDELNISPDVSTYVQHRLSLQHFTPLLELAMKERDGKWITKWIEWIVVWLDYPLFPYRDKVDDKEQELANDLITHYRYMATLSLYYPDVWKFIPTNILVRIHLRLLNVYLPAYLSYFATDAENWRHVTAPLLLCYAFLLDEFTQSDFAWIKALEEMEAVNYNIVLLDGTTTQIDPWYTFMYYQHACCLDLLNYRKKANYFIPDEQRNILTSPVYEQIIYSNLAKVNNYLYNHVQYDFRYPWGHRIDGREMVSTLYNGSGTHSGPVLYSTLNSSDIYTSTVFPYGGMFYTKTRNSAGLLYNSPSPGAAHAYRSRQNNNQVVISIDKKDYLCSSERGRYEYISSPVHLFSPKNNTTYQQFFHYRVKKDNDLSVRHKGYRVNSWNNKANVRYSLGDQYDLFDSVYQGPFLGNGNIIHTSHRRQFLHDKKNNIWLLVDYVEDDYVGKQHLWLGNCKRIKEGVYQIHDLILSITGGREESLTNANNGTKLLVTSFTGRLVTLLSPDTETNIQSLIDLVDNITSMDNTYPDNRYLLDTLPPIKLSSTTKIERELHYDYSWSDFIQRRGTKSGNSLHYQCKLFNLRSGRRYRVKIPENYNRLDNWNNAIQILVNGEPLILHVTGYSQTFVPPGDGKVYLETWLLKNEEMKENWYEIM